MKFTQIISLSLAALAVNGAGIPTQNNGNSTVEAVNTLGHIETAEAVSHQNVGASDLEAVEPTNPLLRPLNIPFFGRNKATAEDVTTSQKTTQKTSEDETRDKVVVVMKDIVGGVLDAFNDFGAAAGIEMNTLLEDTGYEVEVSTEKRNQRAELEKRTGVGLIVGLVPVALRLLKVVLGGVSSLTGAACGTCISRPELAFAANAAGAISAVL